MKTATRFTTLFLAAAVIFGLLAVPAQAKTKKVTNWRALKEVEYIQQDGKWRKSYTWEQFYKGDRSTGYKNTNFNWNPDTQKYNKTVNEGKSKFNTDGTLKSQTYYTNGKKTSKCVYSHNKQGRTTSYKTYNANNKLVSTTTYKFNDKGRFKSITTKYKDPDRKKENSILVGDTTYDAEGAQNAGIRFLAVSYGYGTMESLEQTDALEIVPSADEIFEAIQKL